MKGLRWLLALGLVASVVMGFVFWHYVQLAQAGLIGASPEPGLTGDESPVTSYSRGVVICGFVGIVCLIALMPDKWRRRREREAQSEPTRSGLTVKQAARQARRRNEGEVSSRSGATRRPPPDGEAV